MNNPSGTKSLADARGTLFVVAAPSGAGKTSLVNALVERHPGVVLSVSYTTRPPRPGERDGTHYHFVSDVEFDRMVGAGEFLEHADVFGSRYGTGRDQVERALRAGNDVVLEIDWQGARQVRAAMTESQGIFILPPSRDALVERLRGRGQDSPEVIESRMAKAREEISHFQEFDFLIVNDDFETALGDLESVLRTQRLRLDRQRDRHRDLLRALLGKL